MKRILFHEQALLQLEESVQELVTKGNLARKIMLWIMFAISFAIFRSILTI